MALCARPLVARRLPKRNPGKPGFGKGGCCPGCGLFLRTEQLTLLCGRAERPEGPAFRAALESGLVALGGDLPDDGGVDRCCRRGRFRFPPALLGGDLDNRLDVQFRVSIDDLEEATGLDFLGGLTTAEQRAVEREPAEEIW